jgi:hypothetical protein
VLDFGSYSCSYFDFCSCFVVAFGLDCGFGFDSGFCCNFVAFVLEEFSIAVCSAFCLGVVVVCWLIRFYTPCRRSP